MYILMILWIISDYDKCIWAYLLSYFVSGGQKDRIKIQKLQIENWFDKIMLKY